MPRILLTAGLALVMARTGFPQDESLFGQIDANHDKSVNSTELEAFFLGLDKNRDGAVDRKEFASRPATAEEGADPALVDRLLRNFDTNNDGRLTRDELPEGGAAAILERFDQNQDEVVSKQELAGSATGHRLWTLADGDKDGTVSGGEVKALLRAIDRNKDGKLTEREFQLAVNPEKSKTKRPERGRDMRRGGRSGFDPDRFFERFDKNNDGVVTADELPGRAQGLLDRLDSDGDGKITRDDLANAPGRDGRGGMQGGGRRGGGMFDRLDSNSDGKLTEDEWPERAKRMMKQIDSDGDGIITRAEFMAGARGRRGRAAAGGAGGMSGGGSRPNRQFEKKAPAKGEPLPDLVAFDSEGKKIRLSSFRGKHTVLVFGCLT